MAPKTPPVLDGACRSEGPGGVVEALEPGQQPPAHGADECGWHLDVDARLPALSLDAAGGEYPIADRAERLDRHTPHRPLVLDLGEPAAGTIVAVVRLA